TIESPEALTEAVRNGSVTSYCFILHERSGQWLPIVRHPHYHQALTSRAAAAAGSPADASPILAEPLAAAAAPAPAPNTGASAAGPGTERSTQAALDVPDLDELLEMPDLPAESARSDAPAPAQPAAATQPAPTPTPTPRTRSRELEFLYVPEVKAGGQPRTTPRTAGPPPRPGAGTPPAPKAERASAPTASAPTASAPTASAPT